MKIYKALNITKNAVLIFLIISLFQAFFSRAWDHFQIILLALFVILTYMFLRKIFLPNIYSPLDLFFFLFIFSSFYLGSVHSFYGKYIWWDTFLHFWGGLIFGLIAYLLIISNAKKPHDFLLTTFIAFIVSSAVNTWWEIYEFALDGIHGMPTQQADLEDTMHDLISANIGALTFVLILFAWNSRNTIWKK